MSNRCKLQKEYYQQYGNYKGNGKYNDEYVKWLEEQILALRIHIVMQAEGSGVSDGAAVGQRSVGTNAVRWECKVCGKSFDENYELYDHYDTVHNKGGELL